MTEGIKGERYMIRILIVEDEEAIANLIRMNLVRAGYQCEIASDGEEAADAISERPFDMILLDIMLPKLNGYEVLEYAKTMEVPVIFLSAMGETQQKVKGLKLGAEDYIAKPFEIAELLARVETVLRRSHKTERKIRVLDIEIDTDSRTVLRGGQDVELTTKEYELLLLLVRNKNRALYRETIYENVWGGEYSGTGRTVDLHIQRLKKKLGLEEHIVAIYKVGYRFVP
jgi:DNA-binding response OmpR family regulator